MLQLRRDRGFLRFHFLNCKYRMKVAEMDLKIIRIHFYRN